MPPRGSHGGVRGSVRGGRGGAAARGGASSTASADAPVQSHEEGVSAAPAPAPAPEAGGDAGPANAPGRAITIDSKSSTPTPAPSARGRFKPKNIRRDANERQQLEEQRQRELAAKIKIEEKEQRDADRRARRGGAGRGRGRGDSSRGGFIKRTGAGHGPFSGDGQQGAGWGSGKGGSGSYSGAAAKVEGSHRYYDRKANEPRVNVDTLHRSPSPGPGYGGERAQASTLPFRIERYEFKKEDAKVATSAELAAEEQVDDDEDDSLFVPQENGNMVGRDIEIAAATDTKAWHAHPAAQEAKVKAEPGTEDEGAMDIDAIPAIPKAPPSPEEKKKKPMTEQLASREQAKERKREKANQDPEVQMAASDKQALMQELGVEPAEDGFYLEKDGRLYLFQFPPILPPLARAAEDDNAANGSGAVPGSSGPQTTESALPPGGGYIGKLNIRKSGKVELDWGGRIFDMGLGTETGFLTTAIIVDEAENDMVTGQGKATGMGKIYNKFVLTPVFDEEEDWNPSLEDLSLEDE